MTEEKEVNFKCKTHMSSLDLPSKQLGVSLRMLLGRVLEIVGGLLSHIIMDNMQLSPCW